MKKCLLVFLCIVCLLLSSCSSNPEHFAMISTASLAVPCMFRDDMKGGGCEVLEEDDYGRILFSMTDRCIFLGEDETATVIMQKYDRRYVYFYEDICYTLDSFSETVDELKERNDWGEPLNESKMSRRRVKYSLDNCLILEDESDFYKTKARWEKALEKDGASIVNCSISDFNGAQILYVIVVETEAKEKECYFSIVDDSSYETEYWKIENLSDYREELAAFKKSCGWQYGF